MTKKHKYAHLSNDQLRELENTKQSGNIVQSSIKQNECFMKTALYRDIKRVWFHGENIRDISDDECEVFFHLLKGGGYIEKMTNKIQASVPIYTCIKTWNTQKPHPPMKTAT